MLVTFLIDSYSYSKTIYKIAERMKTKGNEIIIIFLNDDSLLKNQLFNFADSIYLLKKDLKRQEVFQGFKSIDYSRLVDILEKSDRIVSWT